MRIWERQREERRQARLAQAAAGPSPDKASAQSSTSEVAWLIAGLGNPGPEYAQTRHNAGFRALDVLCGRHTVNLVDKYGGLYNSATINGTRVALLMPLTYMNLSGSSVKKALRELKLSPAQLLVVHDEIDLPFGQVQVKLGGGLAGHNGLKSIAEHLQTQEFARVRMGVGRPEPGDRRPVADWVLRPFDTVDDTDALFARAADAVERVIGDGVQAAMGAVNTAQ